MTVPPRHDILSAAAATKSLLSRPGLRMTRRRPGAVMIAGVISYKIELSSESSTERSECHKYDLAEMEEDVVVFPYSLQLEQNRMTPPVSERPALSCIYDRHC